MKSKKSLIENLSDSQKKAIQKLDDETLTCILQNKAIALEYAKKGIIQIEPEKLKDEYIELVAESMQILARIVLEERNVLRES